MDRKRSATDDLASREDFLKNPLFSFRTKDGVVKSNSFEEVTNFFGDSATLYDAAAMSFAHDKKMAYFLDEFKQKLLSAYILDSEFQSDEKVASLCKEIRPAIEAKRCFIPPEHISLHYINITCSYSIDWGDESSKQNGDFILRPNQFLDARSLKQTVLESHSKLNSLSQDEVENLQLFFRDVDAICCSFGGGKPSFYFAESIVNVPELTRVANIVISVKYTHQDDVFSLKKSSTTMAIRTLAGKSHQYAYKHNNEEVNLEVILFPEFINQLLNGEIITRKTELLEVNGFKLVPFVETDLSVLHFYQIIGTYIRNDAKWANFIGKIMKDFDAGFEFSAMALPSWCGKTQTAFSMPVQYKCLYFVMIRDPRQKIYRYFKGISDTLIGCASYDYSKLRPLIKTPVEGVAIVNENVVGKSDLDQCNMKLFSVGMLWILISNFSRTTTQDPLPLNTFLKLISNEITIPCLSLSDFQKLVAENNIDLSPFVVFLDEFPSLRKPEFYPAVLFRNILRYLKIKAFVMSTSTGITNITEHSSSRSDKPTPAGDIEWCVVARKLKKVCEDYFFQAYPKSKHYKRCLESLTSNGLADFIQLQVLKSRPGISFILIKSILSASILLGRENDPVVTNDVDLGFIDDIDLTGLQALQLKWFWALCSLMIDSMVGKQLTLYGCISILFPLYDLADLEVEEDLEDLKKQKDFLYPCSNVNGHLFYLGDPYFSKYFASGFRFKFSSRDTFHLYKNFVAGEIVKKKINGLDRLSQLYSIPPSWKFEFFGYLYSFTNLQTQLRISQLRFRDLWYREFDGKICPSNERELRHNSGMMAESFAVTLFIIASHFPLRCLLPVSGDRSQMFASTLIPQNQKLGDFFFQILDNCFYLREGYEFSIDSYLESLKIHVPILSPSGRLWPKALIELNPSLFGNCGRHPNSDRCDFSFDIYREEISGMSLDKCFFEVKDKENFGSPELFGVLKRLQSKNRLLNLVACREDSLRIPLQKSDYDAVENSDIQEHPFLDEVQRFTTWWKEEKRLYESVLQLGLRNNFVTWIDFLHNFAAKVESFVQKRRYITELYAAKLAALNEAIEKGSDYTVFQSDIMKSIVNLLGERSSLELIHDIKMCHFNLFIVRHSKSTRRGFIECLLFDESISNNLVILPILAGMSQDSDPAITSAFSGLQIQGALIE